MILNREDDVAFRQTARKATAFWARGSLDPRLPMFDNGGQLHDSVRDDSWSEWLEEMGAAVW